MSTKPLLIPFFILLTFVFLGSECATNRPGTCLDNTLIVAEALNNTYPIVIVEGDYYPDKRHVDCFYWEDGKWKRGYWTGTKIIEIPQDWNFNASIYSYEEYLTRVKNRGWR